MRDARLASGFEGSSFVNTLFMPRGGLLFEFDTSVLQDDHPRLLHLLCRLLTVVRSNFSL